MIVRVSLAGATQEFFAGVAQALAKHNAKIFRVAREHGPVTPPHVRGRYRPVEPSEEIDLRDAAELDEDEEPVDTCASWAACAAGWGIALGKNVRLLVERGPHDVWHATAMIGREMWDPARELPWTS